MKNIERAARSGRFKQLVIVADPRMLGKLRKCMPAEVSDRVSREINSDLSWLPESDIDQRIRAAFALR
jgi:protein required for attachment to host cells